MPEGPAARDGEVDIDGDQPDYDGGESPDTGYDDDLRGDDDPGDFLGGGADAGPGLTELEREQLVELERIRAAEGARDRLERVAREREVGGGGGTGSPGERDALAVIDAARRVGLEEDDDEAVAERERITAALAIHAERPQRNLDEYHFFAIITKQTADRQGDLALTMKVPWEHREEVFRALETMPFQAMVTMREVAPLD